MCTMPEKGTKREAPSCEVEISTPSKKKKIINKKSSLLDLVLPNEFGVDFTNPTQLLTSLLSGKCSLESFFSDYWEKKHLVIQCNKTEVENPGDGTSDLPAYFSKLFNMDILKEIITNNEVEYTTDLNACKYVDRKRENCDEEGNVKFDEVKKLFDDDKMTLQFHQPQRFHKELWKIQEMMECYFGCLVGSNIYMTPEGTQGLAPHYDDVEVFVLQLEGSKVWKLYSPVYELPRECSIDLEQSLVDKLTLIDTVTMNPGDIMYFPRGTIHEAKVLEGAEKSTHITISTFQNHCWGDYLIGKLPCLTDMCTDHTIALRKGLPINYFRKTLDSNFKTSLKQALLAMAEEVEKGDDDKQNNTIDSIAQDFFANRLPPSNFSGEPIGRTPSLSCSVKLTFPEHTIISWGKGSLGEIDTMEEEDEEYLDESCDLKDEDPPSGVYVYHTLKNDRTCHMVGQPATRPDGLRFDISCWDSLQKLTNSKDYIEVAELKIPEDVGLDMLVGLWAEGILACKD